jgi:hypothetical protein
MTGFGIMCHYLADAASSKSAVRITSDDWNRRVDGFDVPRFTTQVTSAGAQYVMFTLGQNSGFYCSPNATYDEIVGTAHSRLSRRDLVGELGTALRRAGVRLIAYVSSAAPANDRAAVEALRCTPEWDASRWQLRPGTYLRTEPVDDRLSEFQRRWAAVLREWSVRWGDSVSGWWVDGCYFADRMYRHAEGPNFRSLAEALRAGNPQSALTFNTGVRTHMVSDNPFDDYTAGETDSLAMPFKYGPWSRQRGDARLHVLSYMGTWWGEGPPRMSATLAGGYTALINEQGGAMTWDVPVALNGEIDAALRSMLDTLHR